MSAYTKGPWIHVTDGVDEGWIRSTETSRKLWVASTVDVPYADGGFEATVGNGDLIAAAPELLEALKFAVLVIDNSQDSIDTRQMHAAIAKAEGK